MEATAKAEIERRSVAAQTTLLAGGFTTEAARRALAEMPTAEAFLPEVSVEELRALDGQKHQQRRANAEVSMASLIAGFGE
jgi:hypothetical protein